MLFRSTDNNRYTSQINIRIFPEEGNIVIHVPVETRVKQNENYHNTIGLALGIRNMFVTDQGNVYGEKFSEYQYALADFVREGNARYQKNKGNNPGRKKYTAGKDRLEATLHTYINAEINRMLQTEKPAVIYLPKLPPPSKAGVNKKINYSVNVWQKGYVKSRLTQKCRERSIALINVWGKDISNACSQCGAIGKKTKDVFICNACGANLPERENTAKNVLQRGQTSSY